VHQLHFPTFFFTRVTFAQLHIFVFLFDYRSRVSALIFTLNIKELFIYHLIDRFSFSRSIDLNCFIAIGRKENESIYPFSFTRTISLFRKKTKNNI